MAENYSLQMAATLLLDEDHVAVADPASRQLMALADRVAATDVTVFINGPTGTGKEVLARFLFTINQAAEDNAFVAVNCAAIPENMLEAILFGHEKGSFTGASTANKVFSVRLMGARCCLTKFQKCPFRFRQNYCALCKSAKSHRLVASVKLTLMCAFWPQLTAKCCKKFVTANSAKICFTG